MQTNGSTGLWQRFRLLLKLWRTQVAFLEINGISVLACYGQVVQEAKHQAPPTSGKNRNKKAKK